MDAQPGALQTLVNVLLQPPAGFAQLRQAPVRHALWALMSVMLIAALANWWFMHGMSPDWIVDQQLQVQSGMSEADMAQARPILEQMAPHTGLLAAVAALVTLPVGCVLLAAIYVGSERLLSVSRHSYGRWFLASAYCLLPLGVGALGLLLLTLLADNPDQPLSLANYASLNTLLLQLPPGSPHFAWASSLDLFQIWCGVLGAVAARVWCGIGWGRALLFGLLPWIAIYGGWALLS